MKKTSKFINFKRNLNNLSKDKYLITIFIIFYLLLFILKICPLFGIFISHVNSSSDRNGLYLTFIDKGYSYKIGDYATFCLSNQMALESAISYGLTKSGGICPSGSAPLLKHICGLPNEAIEYKDNNFIKDGFKINNDFLKSKKLIHDIDWKKNPIYLVPSNSYFICGDNKMSFDSRYYGAINKSDILGRSYLLLDFKNND